MRKFYLDRKVDASNVSGIGRVAEGVQYSDGSCVLRWLTDWPTTTVYDGIDAVKHIHGHGGMTAVVWEDSEQQVILRKPHLALGAEGPDAELVAATNGICTVEFGLRLRYDALPNDLIRAPQGWSAYSYWYAGGSSVCIRLCSPSRYLGTEIRSSEPSDLTVVKSESFWAEFSMDKSGKVCFVNNKAKQRAEDIPVSVAGVEGFGVAVRSESYP